MTLRQHSIYSLLVALPLFVLGGATVSILFLMGGVLIDVDHYLLYVIREKRYSIREMFRYHQFLFSHRKEAPYAGMCFFHTLEVLGAVGAAAIYLPVLGWLLAGMVYHFCLDLLHLYRCNYVSGRAFSIVEHFLRVRKHRGRGYPYLRDQWRGRAGGAAGVTGGG